MKCKNIGVVAAIAIAAACWSCKPAPQPASSKQDPSASGNLSLTSTCQACIDYYTEPKNVSLKGNGVGNGANGFYLVALDAKNLSCVIYTTEIYRELVRTTTTKGASKFVALGATCPCSCGDNNSRIKGPMPKPTKAN